MSALCFISSGVTFVDDSGPPVATDGGDETALPWQAKAKVRKRKGAKRAWPDMVRILARESRCRTLGAQGVGCEPVHLQTLDWIIVGAYVAFALATGIVLSRRASRNVDEFFLSGRNLPWWLAGTSMVATTFASDTPLVVTGWVRDYGIWKNWLWWPFAIGGMLTVFLFARLWRRGEVMTTAELAELRYGGRGARALRGFLGLYHSCIHNTIVLCWVLLAAIKIMDVLLGADPITAVAIACGLSLIYSLLAGLWGVVMTDLVQFAMAMTGAIWLAVLSWAAVGGAEGVNTAWVEGGGKPWLDPEVLSFLPGPGEGGFFDASYWTTPVAALAVYLGVAWWAKDGVDGGGVVVQRLAASRDERHGTLAALWFNIACYALRPWPWIIVAVASLVVLPPIEVTTPMTGSVVAVEEGVVQVESEADRMQRADVRWSTEAAWHATASVAVGDAVEAGDVVAQTDSERAYPAMMAEFLPVGLLGLVVASLLAAFMSTIDTHVNLSSAYFVNDVYRRYFRPEASPRHYVMVARIAGVVTMGVAALWAVSASSISNLFLFFLAILGGVGPVYVLRWIWWRVRASTEITAMVASSLTTVFLSPEMMPEALRWDLGAWHLGPLSPGGVLSAEGRLLFVVAVSLVSSLVSLCLVRAPDPKDLVDFYTKVRPAGFWGPVAALVPDVPRTPEGGLIVGGILGGLAVTYGILFAIGHWIFGRVDMALGFGCLAVVGAVVIVSAIQKLTPESPRA